MFRGSGLRWQVGLVVGLFLASLGMLLFNVFASFDLPRQELNARAELQEAGARLAEAAGAVDVPPPSAPVPFSAPLNEQLRQVAQNVLKDYRGLEGGFYVAAGGGWFAGYAFPTSTHRSSERVPRNDPPPLEMPLILEQVFRVLDSGEKSLRTEDVGPSRVVLLVQPVGAHWPARLTVWLMFRLTGPAQLEAQLRWNEVSTGLALGGVALSLVLTWNLGRSLKRQRLEHERLRDELRRAEHLAGLGKLLAGVAHEVRNPLAGIRSTVQLWDRLPEQARTPESMAAVVAAVDRLNAIVSSLLHFARADSAERQSVDINGLLSEGLDLVAAQAAGQGVTLERDLSRDLPAVLGSANALRQVALNLLTNALQAMPAGGTLRCSTRLRPGGRAVEVRVTDTGAGIPAEARPHLFEPFFTTRPEGTGLGLAICREIVQAHGGRVELAETGAGRTTFRVELPAQPPLAA